MWRTFARHFSIKKTEIREMSISRNLTTGALHSTLASTSFATFGYLRTHKVLKWSNTKSNKLEMKEEICINKYIYPFEGQSSWFWCNNFYAIWSCYWQCMRSFWCSGGEGRGHGHGWFSTISSSRFILAPIVYGGLSSFACWVRK